MLSVLCVMPESNYYKIDGLDLWDKERDAYKFTGNNKVITHAPCQQWSKLKSFAKPDKKERDLAFWCWEVVNRNGGIFEHPKGSSFFKEVKAERSKMFCVWQSWWGFRARKETILYCQDVRLLSMPISFNNGLIGVSNMNKGERSKMPLSFCNYLVNCIYENK